MSRKKTETIDVKKDRRGNKKGTIPKSYENGNLQKKNLSSRTPEERKRISQMGVEARRRNSAKRKTLKECLKIILENDVINDKQKELLKQYGFDDDNTTNQAMIMLALFKKGLSGDVSAIREILLTMEKLDMINQSKQLTSGNVTINLVTKNNDYESVQTSESEPVDIWSEESDNMDDWNTDITEDTDDWGNEVYNP